MPYSPKQADVLLNANARWNILWGAARSGKSHVSFDLLLRRLVELPCGDRLIIGRTRSTVERNVLGPLRRKLGPAVVSRINSHNIASIAGLPFYVSGADRRDDAAKLQGLGLVYAYGDEITTWCQDVFVMLGSRLSSPGALFDGTCNPAGPSHWLKRSLLDKSDLDVKQWHFTLDDNPCLPPDYVDNLKKEYSGVFYDRFVLGLWTRAEGAIFPSFADNPDPWIHDLDSLLDRFGQLPLSKLHIGVDFGGNRSNHAFSAVGLDRNLSLYALKSVSIPAKGVDVNQLLHLFLDFLNDVERLFGPVDGVFCDSAEQTLINSIRSVSQVPVFNSLKRPILDRVRTTSLLLGDKRLFILRNLNDHLIDGLRLAVWDDSSSQDRRLDDGSSDIDILDAFEYAWEPWLPVITKLLPGSP